MRLVAYVRVSTNGQAEHCFGLDVQHSQVTEWAERHGHEIVRIEARPDIRDAGPRGLPGWVTVLRRSAWRSYDLIICVWVRRHEPRKDKQGALLALVALDDPQELREDEASSEQPTRPSS